MKKRMQVENSLEMNRINHPTVTNQDLRTNKISAKNTYRNSKNVSGLLIMTKDKNKMAEVEEKMIQQCQKELKVNHAVKKF
jgi:hypothetical protein